MSEKRREREREREGKKKREKETGGVPVHFVLN